MAHYACILQEGQVPDRKRAALAAGLRQIGAEVFGDPASGSEIVWITIRPGFGFTAGKPSTASIVVRSVPPGYPDDRRQAFMTRVCDLWAEVTGCTTTEIVVTAMDGPLPL